jgi:hypothetical protein
MNLLFWKMPDLIELTLVKVVELPSHYHSRTALNMPGKLTRKSSAMSDIPTLRFQPLFEDPQLEQSKTATIEDEWMDGSVSSERGVQGRGLAALSKQRVARHIPFRFISWVLWTAYIPADTWLQ